MKPKHKSKCRRN